MTWLQFTYRADATGLIYCWRDEKWQHTGVLLPNFANRDGISELDLLDEIDIVYKPLSSGIKRRHLMLTTDETGNV